MKSPKAPALESLRIQVYLARMGIGSRREIETLIREGKITVNGKPAKLGQKILIDDDQIKVRNKLILKNKAPIKVVMVNKPRGVVSTAKDPEGRRTVVDLVPSSTRLYPVGRLDINSEGLILLTNDGELANRLTHPRYEIPKVYDVKIRGLLDTKKLDYLKKGVRVANEKYKGAEVLSIRDVTRVGMTKAEVRIKVYEGKNHHVRNMFETIKCHVIRLKRVEMGPIELKGVPRGAYKYLDSSDLNRLRKAVGL